MTCTFFSQHVLPGGSGGGWRRCNQDESQTSDWGCWKPKIQLIEKEFRRKSWWGGGGKMVGQVPGLLKCKWSIYITYILYIYIYIYIYAHTLVFSIGISTYY